MSYDFSYNGDELLDRAATLEDTFPACAERLWGDYKPGSYYREPGYYMGADLRGDIVAATLTPKIGNDTVDVANFRTLRAMLEEIDPGAEHWTEHYFGHWATDFEALHVNWKAPYLDKLEEAFCAMSDYPLLDEELHSEIEEEAAQELWELYSMRDRIDLCREHGVSIFAARAEHFRDAGLKTYEINPDHIV